MVLGDRETISPLVGDHNSVCGDMVTTVKIVIDQLMRNALAR